MIAIASYTFNSELDLNSLLEKSKLYKILDFINPLVWKERWYNLKM